MAALAKGLNVDDSKLNNRKKLTLEMIVSLIKLQQRLSDEFEKNIPLNFDQSESLRKALGIFNSIQEGTQFKKFMAK